MGCSFTQNHFTQKLSNWELQLFTWQIMLRCPLDGSNVEQLQQVLSYFWQALDWNLKLPRGGSHGDVESLRSHFQEYFIGLSWILCLVSLPCWYLTLSIATLHLLELLRTWTTVELSMVWALHESLSTPSIKFLKIASSSSQWSSNVMGPFVFWSLMSCMMIFLFSLDKIIELSLIHLEFWSGNGCFACNTFHVQYVFNVRMELVLTFEWRKFYINALGAKLILAPLDMPK